MVEDAARNGGARKGTIMIYHGYMENGVVIFPEAVDLPEGAQVRVELAIEKQAKGPPGQNTETLGRKMLKHAGRASGLPADAARNHDHYLYGSARK